MTKYNFDQILDRRKSDSLKWRYYGDDVIPMWVADMDFVSPEPVLQALHERVDHGVYGYPVGLTQLPEKVSGLQQLIIDRLACLYDWHILAQDLVLLPGVVTGFHIACHTLVPPKNGVLVQTPVYYPILNAAKNTERLSQEMELTHNPDGSYSVDWDLFADSITSETRLFILCNPQNPVGKVFSRPELESLAEICLQRDVIICSDEIHCDLVYQGYRHIPIASLDPVIAQNTVTLMAPSKTFNLPGLQCSFAIIQNRDLREKYKVARKGLVPWVNLMGQVAAEAAYRDGGDWLAQLLQYLEGIRDYLYDYVQDELPGLSMAEPQGTYLAWLDCRATRISGNPYEFFLEKAGVAFNDGIIFGRGGDGFVRINFGCPRSTLAEAMERMKVALIEM
ncbi:MalY/PatB family protein [Chloroflexota bacterium]